MITAEIVKDSISEEGARLTTFQLVYPRFIHSELMTHRVFSRNAASSRAIPVKKMMQDLRDNPAGPVYWGSNKPGMQAGKELEGWRLWLAKKNWMFACYLMLFCAWVFMKIGVHKQIANRILEPWFHMRTIVTATEYMNFFALRRHPDAQPEIKVLADAMHKAYLESVPDKIGYGKWHLPYIKKEEMVNRSPHDLIKMSVARCCRVSYLNHDGTAPSIEKDISLYSRLLADGHMSPFEHAARPYDIGEIEKTSNFSGWYQHRKSIKNEAVFHG